MSYHESVAQVIEKIFWDSYRPDNNKHFFTHEALNIVASEMGIGNRKDTLYEVRHGRSTIPASMTGLLLPGNEWSILNDEATRHPYFIQHPIFRLPDIHARPALVYSNTEWQPLDEQRALSHVEKLNLLEEFFHGDFREIHHRANHMKCGQRGEIDGVWDAICNRTNQRVVICINSKTDNEVPSGLFVYDNTEIIIRKKKINRPVVHVFAYSRVALDQLDLYQVRVNTNLSCNVKRAKIYHIDYRR